MDTKFSPNECYELREEWKNYLSHRIFAEYPHLTFKRFLVSKGKNSLCDLLDAYRKGELRIPALDGKDTFSFTAAIGNYPLGWIKSVSTINTAL